MKPINYLIACLLLGAGMTATAQDKNTKKADQHYDRLEYIKAAEEYEKLIKRKKANTYVYTQLGHSYYYIGETQKAEPYYRRAARRRNADPQVIYNYAQVLKTNGKPEESTEWMQTFSESLPTDSRASAFKQNPGYLREILDREEVYVVEPVNELNSGSMDFGGEWFGSTLYFASNRDSSGKTHRMNNMPYFDLYEASYEDGKFRDVKEVSGDVNTPYHEGVVTMSPDGKRMYFDRNDYLKKYEKDDEGINRLNIYYATNESGEWSNIKPASFNNSEYSVAHPAISPDGRTLYFVSDMPGGIGGKDLYKVSITSGGSFGKPENLGPGINTEGDEQFPFVADDGTLYFSSNGHLGLGGLDVFTAEPQGSGFGGVKNMGTPVNSPSDDFAFKLDSETDEGFVSSNRAGKDNIYRVHIPVCESVLNVVVLNEYTREPIPGTDVQLAAADGREIDLYITNSDGKTDFAEGVECEETYLLSVEEQENFEAGSATVTSNPGPNPVEILLRPIEELIVEEKIVLENIYFEFDKWDITPQGAAELDKLVDIMERYPNFIISVESHTDNRGSADYNRTLSDKRAKSTVAYVIEQGIDASRINGQGFGEDSPAADCGADCTEEQHDQNRRSEFNIVER